MKMVNRQREALEYAQNNANEPAVRPDVDPAESTVAPEKAQKGLFQGAKTISSSSEPGWSSQIFGAAALGFIAVTWGAVSYLEK